jgi:hypothetical protein
MRQRAEGSPGLLLLVQLESAVAASEHYCFHAEQHCDERLPMPMKVLELGSLDQRAGMGAKLDAAE